MSSRQSISTATYGVIFRELESIWVEKNTLQYWAMYSVIPGSIIPRTAAANSGPLIVLRVFHLAGERHPERHLKRHPNHTSTCGSLLKTTCLLYKGQEFSSKWFSEADLELHFSGLDLNIRLVVCMAACLWRRRSVTEQYYCKFLKTGRDLNDIWNDIWTTSERHPNSSQVIIDPFDCWHPFGGKYSKS